MTSLETPTYNCIAWAAGRTDTWWWPDAGGDYFWPTEAAREESVAAFLQVFGRAGYEPCDRRDPEPGFEKIALYVDGSGVPTHAARQLASGVWASKLGTWEDIEHRTLVALGGPDLAYGTVAVILRRPRSTGQGNTPGAT